MKIQLTNVSVTLGGKTQLDSVSFHIDDNVHLGICGPSGSGKSTLAKVITGELFCRGEVRFFDKYEKSISPRIVLVEQQHRFKNRSNVSNFYYQQRYNSTDNEDSFTVLEELNRLGILLDNSWINAFDIERLFSKPMIQLSNGENKRLQLVKALTTSPEILILDNPYLGLDKDGRIILSKAINEIAESGIKIVLITSAEDLPACINQVLRLENGKARLFTHKEFLQFLHQQETSNDDNFLLLTQLYKPVTESDEEIVEIKNLNIRYGDQQILKNINWKILRGERWCVTGPNGSGKSTLLSLITADNPQGFANDIYLFGKKRGSGESIWDIKSKIGYLSPELHLYFEQGITCMDAIASGLFDTIGLFRKLNKEQENKVLQWIDAMGISSEKDKYIHQLSLGKQRWAMLIRALIKSPELLILDEPCQGLDQEQTKQFVNLIDDLCNRTNLTLIYVSHYSEDIPKSITHRLYLDKGMTAS